jgi:hypothetical protein
MTAELLTIAGQCDGVRCDMAMLVLPEVFARTWGKPARPFWPEAIRRVREQVPGFCFLAEVYWDMEATLLEQGFDYAYDKRLYDRLREGRARPVRDHVAAPPDYQIRLARFLENHDEPRAAATFSHEVHQAAAVITYLSPGLRFFHQGQFEGRNQRISPHLVRAPAGPDNARLARFYARLLAILREPVVRHGHWQLLDCLPAWDGNQSFDSFITFAWQANDSWLLVAVNFAPHQSQTFVRLPFSGLSGQSWLLRDRLETSMVYERDGDDLHSRGLYLDVAPWQCHVLALEPASAKKT